MVPSDHRLGQAVAEMPSITQAAADALSVSAPEQVRGHRTFAAAVHELAADEAERMGTVVQFSGIGIAVRQAVEGRGLLRGHRRVAVVDATHRNSAVFRRGSRPSGRN